MKSTASPTLTLDPISNAIDEQLPGSARRHLAALRDALDDRLSRLEKALADPGGGAALETLILDLARVATQEARAAAALACVEAKVETDTQLARMRVATDRAVEAERHAASELRDALEGMEQRYRALEQQKEDEIGALRDELATAIAGERARVAAAEHALHAAEQDHLAARDASAAELARTAARIAELTETVEREEARAARADAIEKRLSTELAASRQAHADADRSRADVERDRADVQSRLDAEYSSSAALRLEVERAAERIQTLEGDQRKAAARVEQLTTELAEAHDEAAERQRSIAAMQSQLDAERTLTGRLNDETEVITRRLSALEEERVASEALQKQMATELIELRARGNALQHALDDSRAAIASERAATTGRQQALERAEEHIAALQREQAEMQAVHRELTGARSTTSEVERTLATTRVQLDTERAAAADLRRSLARAEEQIAALQTEQTEMQTIHHELTGARATTTEVEGTLADTRAQLDTERAAAADLRRALARAEEHIATLQTERTEMQAIHHELTGARATTTEVERTLADTLAQLDAERAAALDLRRALERAEDLAVMFGDQEQAMQARIQDLTTALARERDAASESERARQEAAAQFDAERAAMAAEKAATDRELRPATSRPGPRAKRVATAPPDGEGITRDDEGSEPTALAAVTSADQTAQTVRADVRHTLPEPIEIQINGDTGLLFDVSMTGCQLQSTARLKPGHGIRMLLPAEAKPVAYRGKVVWARLELPANGRPLGYRAGVQFVKPDRAAIEAFIARHIPAE